MGAGAQKACRKKWPLAGRHAVHEGNGAGSMRNTRSEKGERHTCMALVTIMIKAIAILMAAAF